MSSSTLSATDICCVLFSRGDGSFHWAIVVPSSTSNMADVFHARNPEGFWEFEQTKVDVSNSKHVCVVVKIGTVTSTDTVGRILQLVQNIPMGIPAFEVGRVELTFTCRVWFKQAIRVLHANGILSCPNVYALEQELVLYGRAQDRKTRSGLGYKYHVASTSR
ncbi:hypothetical protein GSI_13126 [Ganoderma sinense ZZ0214-1]|uniref:Uncharacterized protein n=1 Tax=Ganoderma sinense ZZ0214-1 TaxID=1077348 RepID=A0A2G8RUQ1_9APHY|nr:hypothetical protein GSI_13126 [Ganoderma sinense ZZ0214-1]